MRVLLTGGAGFIGSHIAEALITAGHEVVIVDALLSEAHGPQPVPRALPARTIQAPLQQPGILDEVLPGIDVVCHQAAMVGHGVDPNDAPGYAAHNDHATATLLARMYTHGVRRLVLASSMVVYGEGRYHCADHGVVAPMPRRATDLDRGRFDPLCRQCDHPLQPGLVPEHAALDPRSTYAASKLAQEQYAAAWARQSAGSVWALRYHNVYGAWMPKDTPYAGVASLFRSALDRGEAPTVLEDGKQLRDFVHVSDVARANVKAVETPVPSPFEPVNICSGEPHTIGDLAEQLARATGSAKPRIVGGARHTDVRHVIADPHKARRLLGFDATTSFAEGVRAFASDPLRPSAAGGDLRPSHHVLAQA